MKKGLVKKKEKRKKDWYPDWLSLLGNILVGLAQADVNDPNLYLSIANF